MHWSDDPVGQLIQSRRALKPDGLFMGTAFGGETLTELRAALGQAEIEIAGGLSPRVAPMADIRDLGALLQRAGLALPVADSFAITATYESPIHLMHDLRAMGEAARKTNDEVTLDRCAQQTALALRVSAEAVRTEFGKLKIRVRGAVSEPVPEPMTRPDAHEIWLLCLLFAEDSGANWLADHLELEWIGNAGVREIVSRRLAVYNDVGYGLYQQAANKQFNSSIEVFVGKLIVYGPDDFFPA